MKWESKTNKFFKKREKWHLWFAWFLVNIDGIVYWLEYIERRAIFNYWISPNYVYRPRSTKKSNKK